MIVCWCFNWFIAFGKVRLFSALNKWGTNASLNLDHYELMSLYLHYTCLRRKAMKYCSLIWGHDIRVKTRKKVTFMQQYMQRHMKSTFIDMKASLSLDGLVCDYHVMIEQLTSNNNNLNLCHASLLCSNSLELSVPQHGSFSFYLSLSARWITFSQLL